MHSLKVIALYFLKTIGFFNLAEIYSRQSTTVLCYHGISNKDEDQFLPANYISYPAFKNQIETLREKGFSFITLNELKKNMTQNRLINREIVITIDDGFKSIFDQMIPYLEQNKIPATLYVTTKESLNPHSIFRLLTAYIFWKSENRTIKLNELGLSLKKYSKPQIAIKNAQNSWEFITAAEEELNFEQREELVTSLSKKLSVPLDEKFKKSFQIIDYEDLIKLNLKYVDIQLHTHSHDMTMKKEALEHDIIQNKKLLEPIAQSKLVHFCYPSGVYQTGDIDLLAKLEIETATTCERGMVTSTTPPLLIPRLIINSKMPEIVLMAELMGLMPIIRKLKSRNSARVSLS